MIAMNERKRWSDCGRKAEHNRCARSGRTLGPGSISACPSRRLKGKCDGEIILQAVLRPSQLFAIRCNALADFSDPQELRRGGRKNSRISRNPSNPKICAKRTTVGVETPRWLAIPAAVP